MSETRHTPGPWVIHPMAATLVWQRGLDRSIASAGGHFSTAEPDGGYEENRANARLISAAPDLYEALKDIVDDYAAMAADHGIGDIGRSRANAAWTALLKAEGR